VGEEEWEREGKVAAVSHEVKASNQTTGNWLSLHSTSAIHFEPTRYTLHSEPTRHTPHTTLRAYSPHTTLRAYSPPTSPAALSLLYVAPAEWSSTTWSRTKLA
jgi:hypothetical protein